MILLIYFGIDASHSKCNVISVSSIIPFLFSISSSIICKKKKKKKTSLGIAIHVTNYTKTDLIVMAT